MTETTPAAMPEPSPGSADEALRAETRRPTMTEARAHGKALRDRVARSAHASFRPLERDPVDVIEEQNASRLAQLVPIRMGRMAQSSFAFYRGSAGQMAADLKAAPRTDVLVVADGDAHVANFGIYASPERRMVFDLNDFDEAGPGPWEWDVKRLAASVVLAGRDIGMTEDACSEAVLGAVQEYRSGLGRLLDLTAVERYYFRVEVTELEELVRKPGRKLLKKATRKAERRTSDQVLDKITTEDVDGTPRIVEQPPIIQRLRSVTAQEAVDTWTEYRHNARVDVAALLEQFELVDGALRIVGVGSVGTRCHILLLIGPAGEPLVLQAKEAQRSVLVTHGGMPDTLGRRIRVSWPAHGREGFRVVSAQRVLQAVSDPFLGWFSLGGRDYYMRQFRDMKGSIDLSTLTPQALTGYAKLCGSLLARGHAQSPDAPIVSGYLGSSDSFDQAIAAWAPHYADQAERDHAALVAAIADGRVAAESGV